MSRDFAARSESRRLPRGRLSQQQLCVVCKLNVRLTLTKFDQCSGLTLDTLATWGLPCFFLVHMAAQYLLQLPESIHLKEFEFGVTSVI